jgi:metal-responsive CopG/Arc/MetJ family transcriptional regulator
MKTAISLPDPLFEEAEAAAKDLGLSRSKLIQTALEEFLQRRRDEEVTAALNRSLAEHPDEVDPFVQELALETMRRVEWKE